MTQDNEYLFTQFKRIYKFEYINKLVKLVSLVLFVLLGPILIYDGFISGEYLTVVFLLIADFLFLFLSYSMYSDIRDKTSFSKSRIYKGFQNQNIVNKIIVSDNKILFDISDMEDETIYLKNSEYKRKIVNSLKSVFGESKIVSNVKQLNFYKMSKLNELKKSILADGVIDEQEVKQLREVFYADGVIDKEEAEFLFELNDAVSGKENHPSWEILFVEAITSFLLEDETSPGIVDENEVNWLLAKIQGDGKLDNNELALLINLKSKAKQFPQSLLNLF